MTQPRQPSFPYDSTLPLLAAFVGALVFLGVIAALIGGGADDPGRGRAVAATPSTTTEPIAPIAPTTTPVVPVARVTLTAGVAGDGHGTILVAGQPHDCSDECSLRLTQGSSITLEARPAKGSTFVGWTGSCTDLRKCSLTMDHARSATALFTVTAPATSSATSDGEFPAAPVTPVTPPPVTTVPPATTLPPTVLPPPPPPTLTTPPPAQ